MHAVNNNNAEHIVHVWDDDLNTRTEVDKGTSHQSNKQQQQQQQRVDEKEAVINKQTTTQNTHT
jgi:hypothetical protein